MRDSSGKAAERFQPDKMLRKRKNRRYNETNDDEGDGERKFDLQEQINAERFDQIREKHLQQLPGEAITLSLIQRHGFEKPILVVEPQGLHLRVPPKSFLIRDVRNCVGPDRIIDVMDVETQKNIEMSMRDWCRYYESKTRDRLLNVISLEFSHTKLDELVESPMIVKLLDWVDLVWPKFLKQSQTESTNSINKMKYPKVQKYCLMSVKGSYTDFHIDFGGTSVWYHILKGRKIFWMVPPTDLNLQIFEEWTLSGMQQDVFFGDTVEECFRVELCAGNTFFIPSGWIHAVYTLEDSLVFGGNFLHSFGIENQLRVAKIEDATKVPAKFRYPFYTEMLWYAVQHYVYSLSGKDHLHRHGLQLTVTPPKDSKLESQITTSCTAKKKQVIKEAIKSNNRNREIEDESTESEYEYEESGILKNKTTPENKRQVAVASTKTGKTTTKNSKKKPETDDESTDIDSGSEELARLTAEKPNTCRMTKNSLLRLQYELDEEPKSLLKKSTKPATGKSAPTNNSNKKSSSTSTKKNSPDSQSKTPFTSSNANLPEEPTQKASDSSNSINLVDILHETKLNGWSGSGGQSIWTNPRENSSEPSRIHITRYEVVGLKVLVRHLSKLSGAKKNLPALIRNSRALLDDCKKLINEHENDDPDLAITGKPITPDLLKSKKADMNDLIGQFFKSTNDTKTDRDSINCSTTTTGTPITTTTTTSTISPKLKFESSNSKNKHVSNSTNELSGTHKACGEDQTGASNNANESNSSSLGGSVQKSSASHKETKCLSPNKKLSMSLSSTNSAIPTPDRPKSPPTRPLSNNQYTSKTKNNNNLLLPGSFADLIAATSTEKKVFNVNSADIASSLFGMKDLSSSTTKLSSSPVKLSPASSQHFFSKTTKPGSKSTSGSTSSSKTINSNSSSPDISASSANNKPSTSNINRNQSAELARQHMTQKRFINPANSKVLNKEKVIFASAPYVNPMNSEQPRLSNQPYSWQTPTRHQLPPLPPHSQQPPTHSHLPNQDPSPTTYSPVPHPPVGIHQPIVHAGHVFKKEPPPHHQLVPPCGSLNGGSKITTTPNTLESQQLLNQPSHRFVPADHHRQHDQHHEAHQKLANERLASPDKTVVAGLPVREEKKVLFRDGTQQPQTMGASIIVPANYGPEHGKSKDSHRKPSSSTTGEAGKPEVAMIVNFNENEKQHQVEKVVDGSTSSKTGNEAASAGQTKEKKITQPRGPPKKSKEARQAAMELSAPSTAVAPSTKPPTLTTNYAMVPNAIPMTAATATPPTVTTMPNQPIKCDPGSKPSSLAPTSTAAPQASTATTSKPKIKRSKKHKDSPTTAQAASPQNAQVPAPQVSVTSAQPLTNIPTSQLRPSIICGLVRPQSLSTNVSVMAPVSSSPKIINPHPSYLISQPLFSFPQMPTLSAAQFQQLQQHHHQQQQQNPPNHNQRPMNLLTTTPMGAQLSALPLQQGARIVWATSQRFAQPCASSSLQPATGTLAQAGTGVRMLGQMPSAATTAPPNHPLPAAAPTPASTSSMPAAPLPVVSDSSFVSRMPQPVDNAALLSLATTALSTAAMTSSSPTLSSLQHNRLPTTPADPQQQQALMMSAAAAAAANQQAAAAMFAGQQFFRPYMQRMPMAHFANQPGAGVNTTNTNSQPTTGQIVFARLPPNQNQPRYLITQPGFMQQRFQSPHIVTSQPVPTLAFGALKPPAEPVKVGSIKTKKVKTS